MWSPSPGIWYVWYLFWYIPWHNKKTPTCCGREIDASCSHGAVRGCKSSCKVCWKVWCKKGRKSCCKLCCGSTKHNHNTDEENYNVDSDNNHERRAGKLEEADEDEEEHSIASSSNPCCPNNGRCSWRESFVAYWQQRSLAHRGQSLPSPSPFQSNRHESPQHHHDDLGETEGFNVHSQSNSTVKSRFDIGQEEQSRVNTLPCDISIPHSIDRRGGAYEENASTINHHNPRSNNLGSPQGTFVWIFDWEVACTFSVRTQRSYYFLIEQYILNNT